MTTNTIDTINTVLTDVTNAVPTVETGVNAVTTAVNSVSDVPDKIVDGVEAAAGVAAPVVSALLPTDAGIIQAFEGLLALLANLFKAHVAATKPTTPTPGA